jgi:hypothetical protein
MHIIEGIFNSFIFCKFYREKVYFIVREAFGFPTPQLQIRATQLANHDEPVRIPWLPITENRHVEHEPLVPIPQLKSRHSGKRYCSIIRLIMYVCLRMHSCTLLF